MQILLKIIRYEVRDLIRSKWVLAYTLFFWLSTDLLFRFGGVGAQVVVSLLNIVLLLIPLVSLLFGMIYLYNSREFIELLLTQPIDRKRMFWGMYLGLSLPLSIAFLIGLLIPLIYLPLSTEGVMPFFYLLFTGIALTFIFSAIAFYLSIHFEDKIKGLGSAVAIWLFLIIAYDGIVMFLLFTFSDYPLDNISIALSLFNPIDLGRIFMLLQLDIAALMGYTGASFARFFGSSAGILISFIAMFFWIFVPVLLGQFKFLKKDF